jgi:putative addiction module component (TIGR02574 family)
MGGLRQRIEWGRASWKMLGTGSGPGYTLGMMQEAQELLKKALALPDKELADLAGNLIDSLDDTVDEDAEAAWQAEIVRRLEEVRAGKVKTTSWDDVRRKGRALLDGR